MKIAIVEDDRQTQVYIQKLIESSAKELNENIIIDIFSDGLEFIDQFNSEYNIIYLDIEMKFLDGMKTAEKIREVDSEVLIVFITNYSQMAIEGYSVDATDFLLKPLNQFTFHEHFKKIIKKLKFTDKPFHLKISGAIIRISQNSILYIESNGHYLDVVTVDEKYTIIDTLKTTETKLDPFQFFRCSNSHIVNFDYIKKFDKNTVYIKDKELPISRSRKKEFLDRFTHYLGDHII